MDAGRISPLYFIYGDEKYMVKRAAKRLIKKLAPESFVEFNLNEFSSDAVVDSISDAAEALPFMAERKLVVVSDFNIEQKNSTEISKLTEMLSALPESTTIIFYFPTVQFDAKKTAKWKNFLKIADKAGTSIFYPLLSETDLKKLITREIEKRKCTISRPNVTLLVEYVGGELNALLNEVDKLCSYVNGGEISTEIIERLVPKSMESTAFILANALVSGNYERAYRTLEILFYAGEEPIAILAALSSVYVDMYRVRAAVQSGLSYSSAASSGEYRGREFRLRNAERNARSLSTEVLRDCLNILLETDILLKSSKLDSRILMDKLIAKLLLATKGEEKL